MSEYFYLILTILIGTIALAILYIVIKGKDSRTRDMVGKLIGTLLWPSIDKNLKKRESIGWIIVVILMIIAVIVAILFPAGNR